MVMSEEIVLNPEKPTLDDLKLRYFKLYAKEKIGKTLNLTKMLDHLEQEIERLKNLESKP